MALSKIDAANFLTGTIPQGNVANASLGAVTALPGAIATGKVLQYKYASTASPVTVSSNTFVDAGITASITPTSASNTIYIDVNCPDNRVWGGNTNMNIKVYRQINGGGYSALGFIAAGFGYTGNTNMTTAGVSGVMADTSHNTTNQVDYKIYINSGQNVAQAKLNVDGQSTTSIIAYEVTT